MKLRGFHDADLVEGGPDAARQAQAELNREQRVRVAMTSGKPELPRSDLAAAHLSLLEHTPSGEYYAICHGVQYGAEFDSFDAFIVERDGDVTFLQRPASGAKSRAELEQKRAEREARRNQPRPKPPWMT